MQSNARKLAPYALLVGVIPLVAVHLALAISMTQGLIETCNPYLQGCTSISRAGRYELANHLFQAFMLPYATLLAGYWLLCTAWLRRLGGDSRVLVWIPVLGIVAAVFLVLYATFLGSDGDFYRLMRRYGVIVYFAFNFLAQLLMAARLHTLATRAALPFPRWVVQVKVALCVGMLALGLTNVFGAMVLVDNYAFENIIEWNAALLMTTYYFMTWWAWRRDGFSLRLG